MDFDSEKKWKQKKYKKGHGYTTCYWFFFMHGQILWHCETTMLLKVVIPSLNVKYIYWFFLKTVFICEGKNIDWFECCRVEEKKSKDGIKSIEDEPSQLRKYIANTSNILSLFITKPPSLHSFILAHSNLRLDTKSLVMTSRHRDSILNHIFLNKVRRFTLVGLLIDIIRVVRVTGQYYYLTIWIHP